MFNPYIAAGFVLFLRLFVKKSLLFSLIPSSDDADIFLLIQMLEKVPLFCTYCLLVIPDRF